MRRDAASHLRKAVDVTRVFVHQQLGSGTEIWRGHCASHRLMERPKRVRRGGAGCVHKEVRWSTAARSPVDRDLDYFCVAPIAASAGSSRLHSSAELFARDKPASIGNCTINRLVQSRLGRNCIISVPGGSNSVTRHYWRAHVLFSRRPQASRTWPRITRGPDDDEGQSKDSVGRWMESCVGVKHPTTRGHAPLRRPGSVLNRQQPAKTSRHRPLELLLHAWERHGWDPRPPADGVLSQQSTARGLSDGLDKRHVGYQCALSPPFNACVACLHGLDADNALARHAANDGARQGEKRRRRMKGRMRKSRTAASGTLSPRFGRMSESSGHMTLWRHPSACSYFPQTHTWMHLDAHILRGHRLASIC